MLTSQKVKVRNVEIRDSSAVFDHFPLTIEVDVEGPAHVPMSDTALVREFVDWSAFTQRDKQNLNIIFVIEMNSCDSGVDARNLNHVRIDDNH